MSLDFRGFVSFPTVSRIVLPALRALHEVYGPVSVIHFDSHCDSRSPIDGQLTHGVGLVRTPDASAAK